MTHYAVPLQKAYIVYIQIEWIVFFGCSIFFVCAMFILFGRPHTRRKSQTVLRFFFNSLEIKWDTLTPHVPKFEMNSTNVNNAKWIFCLVNFNRAVISIHVSLCLIRLENVRMTRIYDFCCVRVCAYGVTLIKYTSCLDSSISNHHSIRFYLGDWEQKVNE